MNSLHASCERVRRPRAARFWLTALVAGLALAVGGCGASATSKSSAGSVPTVTTNSSVPAPKSTAVAYDGPTLQSPAQAPPIVLKDHLGHRVDTAAYRGKVVLDTFIYTHCPDVCPLIVANLHNMLALLGRRASDVRIVAVSTDPKGDTPTAVASFLARHEMTGRMEYLVGTRRTLIPVWRAWGINTSKPTAQDEVNHSALVYGLTASGKVTTVYASNFKPADLAHDVPLLAAN